MNRNNNQNNNYFGNNYNQNQGNYYNGNNRRYGNYNNRQYNNNNRQYNNQYYNQNGQYNSNQFNQPMNNFTPYNNPNNKNKEKKLNKELLKKIGIGAGIAVFLLLVFFMVKGCTKSEKVNEEVNEQKEVQTVGTSQYGYLTIPNDWLRLEGTSESTGLRYSDKDIIYAVTLDTSSSLSPEEFVYTARNQLQEAGVSNFEIVQVNFNNYNAYKLVGYHQGNNKHILAYFFKAEDNVTHYVGIEGPDNQSDNFKILDTYKLIK